MLRCTSPTRARMPSIRRAPPRLALVLHRHVARAAWRQLRPPPLSQVVIGSSNNGHGGLRPCSRSTRAAASLHIPVSAWSLPRRPGTAREAVCAATSPLDGGQWRCPPGGSGLRGVAGEGSLAAGALLSLHGRHGQRGGWVTGSERRVPNGACVQQGTWARSESTWRCL